MSLTRPERAWAAGEGEGVDLAHEDGAPWMGAVRCLAFRGRGAGKCESEEGSRTPMGPASGGDEKVEGR